jgi:hypothetical protein
MKCVGKLRAAVVTFFALAQLIGVARGVSLDEATTEMSLINSGLVANFPFSGNAKDESGFGNNGTVNGATLTADRVGQPNSAYHFDGVDDYIRTADSPSLNLTGNLSIAAWIRPTRASFGVPIIFSNMLEVSPHDGYQLRFASGGGVRFMSGDISLFGSKVVPLNTWTHVAATLSGATARIYINGVLDVSGTVGVPTSSSVAQTIGASYSPFYFFQGEMDEVRIYNRALANTEVQALTLIPEPSSAVLSLGGAVVWLSRRRGGKATVTWS